jgi:hypothetical protein
VGGRVPARARNISAVLAVVVGLAALAVLGAGVVAVQLREETEGLAAAGAGVGGGAFLALLALSLARRARLKHQRTLGRAGGTRLAAAGRALGVAALLVAITGALALGVFAVLALFPELRR